MASVYKARPSVYLCELRRVGAVDAKSRVKAIQTKMEIEENFMYPECSEKPCEDSQAHMSQVPLELHDKHMDFSIPGRQKNNQVVPEQREEHRESRRQRLSIWRYHCQVETAKVTDKRSKLTEAAKLLSAEEMQLLEQDIFNPLDIALIISKNSKITQGN